MNYVRWYMRRLSMLANAPPLSEMMSNRAHEQYLLKSSEICLKAMAKLAMLEMK